MKNKILSLFMCLSMVMSLGMVQSFAAEEENSATTPIIASVEGASFDFSVSEGITFEGTAGSNDAEVSDHVITNNAEAGQITASISLSDGDWTAKTFDTSWADESVSTHAYGLKANDEHDMFEYMDGEGLTVSNAINPGNSVTTEFSGKAPIQGVVVENAHIADIVTTVEWVKAIELPEKGDIITLDGGTEQFRVIKVNGLNVEVLSMNDVNGNARISYSEYEIITTEFNDGKQYVAYKDNLLDQYINGGPDFDTGSYYDTLSDNIKSAIIPQNITQYAYTNKYDKPDEYAYKTHYIWNDEALDEYFKLEANVLVGERNVYLLDLKDIFEYFNKGKDDALTAAETNMMFFNKEESADSNYTNCWLRSAKNNSKAITVTDQGVLFQPVDAAYENGEIRPAFTIDLSKVEWSKIE